MAKRATKTVIEPDKALAKLPAKTQDRTALFIQMDRLKADQQAAAGECSAHRKRMVERFGLTKQAIKIRDVLAKCNDNDYAATIAQLQLLLDDIDRPLQLDMFTPKPEPKPVEEEPEPVEEEPIGAAAVADLPPRRRGRPPKAIKEAADRAEARSLKVENSNKHLKKAAPPVDLATAKTEFERARNLAEKKRGSPAAAIRESAAESEEFLAKQIAKQKKPPKAPEPANDTFLDDSDPERQGSYELQ